jgi:bacterioferritin
MAKGSKKVIDLLNEARSRELTAILTYMAQHYELENDDYGKLAKVLKATGIAEMKHAETLADRILFLGGVPGAKPDAEIKRGEKIGAKIATDIALEELDHVSKGIFEKLLADETDHLDMFINIKEHIDQLGDQYLATLTGE